MSLDNSTPAYAAARPAARIMFGETIGSPACWSTWGESRLKQASKIGAALIVSLLEKQDE